MREIKFRAWNKENKKMDYFHLTHGDSYGIGGDIFPEYEIMQYTGLKDKNGKEIYEGDIIKHILWDKPYSEKRKSCEVISKVVWSSGNSVSDNDWNNEALAKDPSVFNSEPCFTTRKIINEKGYGCCSWSHFSGCEVIGNIYENPDLLTLTKEN